LNIFFLSSHHPIDLRAEKYIQYLETTMSIDPRQNFFNLTTF